MEVARWIALIVAVLGVCLQLSDLIINIKKRKNTRMNIIGFVFLTLSLVCFVLTQFVFKEQLPQMLTLIWIPFLAGYLVCDIIIAVCIGRQNARLKREQKNGELQAAQESAQDVGENSNL